MSWDTLTTAKASDLPPRLLIYGPEKMGKTSLACEFPNPIFLRVECGPPEGLELPGWDITSMPDLEEKIGLLYNDDHDFKTVVIDSISALESKVIWPHIVETILIQDGPRMGEKADHIEDYGFGKGYAYALQVWEDVIDGMNSLRRRGMTTVMIGHSTVKEFKDPETQTYSVYDIALQDAQKVSASARLKREVDAILFIKQEVSAEKEDPKDVRNKRVLARGGSKRFICTEKRPAYSAGNRYGMPEKITYEKGKGFSAMAQHISALAQYLPVTTKQAA
jgi:ribosomal protein S15P/S13E